MSTLASPLVEPVNPTLPSDTKPLTPAEFLNTLPGAPSAEQIAAWKQQAPNNRLEVFTPDGKRAYILRGITGLELIKIQKKIESMATPSSNPDFDVQLESVITACLWTNAGDKGKLTDIIMRTGTAGLPGTLFTKVSKLSDFLDPQQIEFLSAEL